MHAPTSKEIRLLHQIPYFFTSTTRLTVTGTALCSTKQEGFLDLTMADELLMVSNNS